MADLADVKEQNDEELIAWGLDIDEGMTTWEVEFMESMKKRLDNGQEITATMRVKLEQIVEERG